MTLQRRFLAPAAIALAGMLLIAGCSGGGGGVTPSDGPDLEGLGLTAEQTTELTALYDAAVESGDTDVMIYSAHHDEFLKLYKEFETRFPGLKVQTGTYVGAELQSTLEAERETKKHVATVITNPNADRYVAKGFAQPYQPVTFGTASGLEDRIAEDQLHDADYNYTAPWAFMFNLSYNTDLIKESDLPQSWVDLTDPEYKGKLTFMTPTTPGGTMTTLTQLLLAGVLTEDDLAALAANSKTVATDQLALQALSSGEFPLQPLAATTSILMAADTGAPVKSHFFEKDNVIATDKWMLADGAPSPDAGKLFLNYIHTIDGQKMAMEIGDFPINQDASLTSPYGWPALEDIDFVPLKPQSEIAPAMAEYTPLFQKVFG